MDMVARVANLKDIVFSPSGQDVFLSIAVSMKLFAERIRLDSDGYEKGGPKKAPCRHSLCSLGQDYGVNHVDYAICTRDVSLHHVGIVHFHLAICDRDLCRRYLNGLCLRQVHDVLRKYIA